MIQKMVNLIFRCGHRRQTRPITPVGKTGGTTEGTYVVCLDCGKQFAYDWNTMHLAKALKPPRHDRSALF